MNIKEIDSFINAIIFKNDFLKIPPTLYYSFEINLHEFIFKEQKINTSIRLDAILLNIYALKELENKVYHFPINPEKGFIHGSIYMFDVHNPIDVNKIAFGKIENNSIDAIIYFDIDFEYENTGFKNITEQSLNLTLQFGELSIDTEIMNAENFNEEEADKLVTQFVSLQDYEKATIENNQIMCKMKSLNL